MTESSTEAVPQAPARPLRKSYWPTRKWLVTQVTALTALLIAWVTADAWDKTLTIALIGLISQAIIGYLVPNQNTPGGVPLQKQ